MDSMDNHTTSIPPDDHAGYYVLKHWILMLLVIIITLLAALLIAMTVAFCVLYKCCRRKSHMITSLGAIVQFGAHKGSHTGTNRRNEFSSQSMLSCPQYMSGYDQSYSPGCPQLRSQAQPQYMCNTCCGGMNDGYQTSYPPTSGYEAKPVVTFAENLQCCNCPDQKK